MAPTKRSRKLVNETEQTPKQQNNAAKDRAALVDKTNQLATVRALRNRKVYLNKDTDTFVKVHKELFKSPKAVAKKQPATKKLTAPIKCDEFVVKKIEKGTDSKKKLVYKDVSPSSAEKQKNLTPEKKITLYDFKRGSGSSDASSRKCIRKRKPVKRNKKMQMDTSDEENCDVECVNKKKRMLVNDEKQKENVTSQLSMNSSSQPLKEHNLSNMSMKTERKFFKTPMRKELIEMSLFSFANPGKSKFTKSSKRLIKRKEKIKNSRAKEKTGKPANSLQPLKPIGFDACRSESAVGSSQILSSRKATVESKIPVLHNLGGISGTKATGETQLLSSRDTSTKLGTAQTKIPLYCNTATTLDTKATVVCKIPSSHKPTSQRAIESEKLNSKTNGTVLDKTEILYATMDTDTKAGVEDAAHKGATLQMHCRGRATMDTGAGVIATMDTGINAVEDAAHKVATSHVNCRRGSTLRAGARAVATMDTGTNAVEDAAHNVATSHVNCRRGSTLRAGARAVATMDTACKVNCRQETTMDTAGAVDVTTDVEEAAPGVSLAASQINYRRGGTFFIVNSTISDFEADCSKKTENSVTLSDARATNSVIPAKRFYSAAPSVAKLKQPQAVMHETKSSIYFYGPLRRNFKEKCSRNVSKRHRAEGVYVPAAPSVEEFTLENYFGFDEEPEDEFMLSPLKHQSDTHLTAPPLTSTPHNSAMHKAVIPQPIRLPEKQKLKVNVSKTTTAQNNQSQILAYGGYSRLKKPSESVTFAVPQLLSTVCSKPSLVQTSITSYGQRDKETLGVSDIPFDTSLSNIEGDDELSVTHTQAPRRSYERPVRSKRRHYEQDDYVSEEEEQPEAKTFSRKHSQSRRLKRSKKQEKMFNQWASNVSSQFEEIDSIALIVE